MGFKKYKHLVTHFTLPFGFTLQRVPKLKHFFRNKNKRPIYIEFIGPSGVGKTTLYRYLNRGMFLKWYDIKHFYLFNSTKISEKKIAEVNIYQHLAASRYNENKDSNLSLNYINKLNSLRTGYNIIREDAANYFYNEKDIILSEEGIVQFYTVGVNDLLHKNKIDIKNFLTNRAYIYCIASNETIFKRIKKRECQTGHRWSGHNLKSEEELYQVIKNNLEEKEQLVKKLKAFIPVLEINTENPLEFNKKKIIEFINSLK